ncbi:arylamine N-acetyltransferase family protein [Alicyclobacillus dauci]|uniref:Arylamine N-acetyltransferase n=1 Tax=Alicyclobacillus dauci TaxID=1475485 RepID=A0ABY6Z0D6_9BACL|nr:arylamine N-acetyltransferase [Alicyclobacillus dauci]WAH35988.1 arylamine N-acetyltransferase [Alicyclobacillus dauci]
MPNELTVKEPNIKRYLERIGITEAIVVDYISLRHIQERHMLSVPFENLNIIHGIPVELDLDSLYDKIVDKRRGGYCYELNGLLAWLLKRLGYRVSLLSGRVIRDDGSFGPEFDHMALLVHLDNDYIVDVGFGDSVRSPLPLSGEVVTDVSGSYRITHEIDSDVLFFQKKLNGEWVSEYRFTLTSRHIEDFRHMNIHQQTSPDSHFTKNLIVSKATPQGRISISGDSFIVTIGSDKERRPILSNDEQKALLKIHFGMDLACS